MVGRKSGTSGLIRISVTIYDYSHKIGGLNHGPRYPNSMAQDYALARGTDTEYVQCNKVRSNVVSKLSTFFSRCWHSNKRIQ